VGAPDGPITAGPFPMVLGRRSVVSAGLGIGSVNTEATEASPGTQESGLRRSVNFGGGARWFIKPRVAFSVDLRAHRMAGGDVTPRVSVFAVSAGMSIR